MRNLLYIIAIVLIVGWVFGFIVYSKGGLIHILLGMSVISVLLGLVNRKEV